MIFSQKIRFYSNKFFTIIEDNYVDRKDTLIPDGFTEKTELSYCFFMELVKTLPSLFTLNEWGDIVFQETTLTPPVISQIYPIIEEYLLEKMKHSIFTQSPQGAICGNRFSLLH